MEALDLRLLFQTSARELRADIELMLSAAQGDEVVVYSFSFKTLASVDLSVVESKRIF